MSMKNAANHSHKSQPTWSPFGWLPVIARADGFVLHVGPTMETLEDAHGYAMTRIRARNVIQAARADLSRRQAEEPKEKMTIDNLVKLAGLTLVALGILRALGGRLEEDLRARHPEAGSPDSSEGE